MGAETTFIDRFTPPAIASMAYLPCCDEWADCRETEECPFCGLDLDNEKVWGPSMMLVKAIFKFDRLEVEGDWSMKQALSAITLQAKSEEPHIEVPEDPVIRTDCPHIGCVLAEGHSGDHNYGYGDGYDGWPCEGWGEERRAECLFEFENCNGKPDCPRNRSLIGSLDEEKESEPLKDGDRVSEFVRGIEEVERAIHRQTGRYVCMSLHPESRRQCLLVEGHEGPHSFPEDEEEREPAGDKYQNP